MHRDEYTLIDIDDGFLNLMDSNGETKNDIKLPEGELGEQMAGDFKAGKELIVAVLTAMGEEAAIAFKEAPKGN